jgi:hypothetical protein
MATASPIIDTEPIDRPIDGPIDTIPGLPQRTVLDDIATAIANYVSTYVNVVFVDVDPESGDAINTNEVTRFKLQVFNNGPLTMKDVKLRFTGRNGTTVKSNSALDVFDGEAFANTITTIGGHEDKITEVLSLKAPPGTKPAGTELVEAFVDDWNALWTYTLNHYSGASSEPDRVYSAQVHAQ